MFKKLLRLRHKELALETAPLTMMFDGREEVA